MILNLTTGAAFKAYIKITYPRGTCSCTSSEVNLSHSGGGTVTFTVGKEGQYTIKIVSGVLSSTKTVSVSSNGETVSVSMSYGSYSIVPNTSQNWSTKTNCSVSAGSGSTVITTSGITSSQAAALTAIDMTGLTSLSIAGTIARTSDNGSTDTYGKLGIFSNSSGTSFVTGLSHTFHGLSGATSKSVNASYDVSSLSGTYYFGYTYSRGSGSATAYYSTATLSSVTVK